MWKAGQSKIGTPAAYQTVYSLKYSLRLVAGATIVVSLQGCAVIAVADAAVTDVATGVKVAAKTVGAVVSARVSGLLP